MHYCDGVLMLLVWFLLWCVEKNSRVRMASSPSFKPHFTMDQIAVREEEKLREYDTLISAISTGMASASNPS
jgi:hypothetical protein